ncbi:DUF1990 family protein [Blastococcus goldschmidtiae]|uniref:DUF1990 domain-containing protein n=1 Tax=Blastococcus goldschmidtiae TaxID=3075546 RepID=A0ABU2KC29_9ACTN|nr:DUF1990 domain-containing protein [Blastococcus sp. DSM 46792]MDT0277743.1 DUF1990 domain-containing protein [Blastococcus sp. DSM 46792]
MDVAARPLTYSSPGAPAPGEETWAPPAGFRAHERTVPVGSGDARWEKLREAVLGWGVKVRSGFDVEPVDGAGLRVAEGRTFLLHARLGPLTVREPVRVVAVVEQDRRCGFAYGTLTGHPVSGEEAFVLTRDGSGAIALTLRSLTRAGHGPWRPVFPALLVAQRLYRRRYERALLRPPGDPSHSAA